MITTSDLNRSLGEVLDRVARGERLIVCRHKKPVATLQPLNGLVVQPFGGACHDVYGRPMDPLAAETELLDDAERHLLRDGIWRGRVIPGRLNGRFDYATLKDAIEDMKVRGLARKSSRGLVLTGRGMMLRGALLLEEGRNLDD
jgi:prevent-host-death family protein